MSTTAEQFDNLIPLRQPGSSAAHDAALAGAGERLSPELFAVHDPQGSRTEALRELRSQLLLRWFDEQRMLAVFGPRRRDGAAVVAANLAIVLAQLGEPVLLIDADMRRPSLHELFGLADGVGLADVLEDCSLCDEAQQSPAAIPNLRVMPAGIEPDRPQELISRTAFTYLTKTLPDHFGAVIVAAPPALDFADAQIVAARAKGCLVVTRRHRTRLADIARVKARLAPAGATLVGGVIRE